MEIATYLERIRYAGRLEPDFATLSALLRHHALSVPFENLDVQLGRPLTTRIEDAYEKIVINARGGWCYEQNGLFGWVLKELGFDVTRVAAAVMREQRGDWSLATHLTLVVSCPGSATRYLVDVGFGGSMLEPIVIEDGVCIQPPFRLGLHKLADGHWQFSEDPGDGLFTFDFVDEPAFEEALAEKCGVLQSDPASSFVQTLVAQRRLHDAHMTLRGRVLSVARPGSMESQVLDSAEALVETLATRFSLDIPGIADLWPRICARHEQVFGNDTTAAD